MGKASKALNNIERKVKKGKDNKSDFIKSIKSLDDDLSYQLFNNGEYVLNGATLPGKAWKDYYKELICNRSNCTSNNRCVYCGSKAGHKCDKI